LETPEFFPPIDLDPSLNAIVFPLLSQFSMIGPNPNAKNFVAFQTLSPPAYGSANPLGAVKGKSGSGRL